MPDKTADPPGRSIVAVEGKPDGFVFTCDCGLTTQVLIEVGLNPPETSEISVTCEGCQTSHWMTIALHANPRRSL